MADRRSLLSRFWPPSASRRPPPPPPPITSSPTPSPRKASSSSAEEPKTSSPRKASSSSAEEPKTSSPRKASPSSAEEPKTSSPRKASSSSAEEPKTSSPSRLTTRSPSSSKPSSPSRFSSQSRSPPQPSSSPQSRTPKRASKPPSPTRVTASPSSKGKKPTSPSTEKISTSHEAPILATKGNDPKLVASQQEAEVNEEVSNAAHGLTQEETSFKQDSVDAKPGETKDVKEIVHETINEANDEDTKKELDDSILKKSNEEEHVPLQKNIRDEMSKFSNKLAAGDHKKAISDRAVSVITLAGENRGASMHMESDSSKREGPIPIHRSYKIKPTNEATTGGDKIAQAEDESSMEDQATEAYVNNNAQAINNSIVFNSSITEGSPGVHMVVSHLHKEPKDEETKSSHETRKAQINMSRAEKLTFQPTVRRRCLRGLLMETSTDSDAEKPRRHGCRVSCKKEERENNLDEL